MEACRDCYCQMSMGKKDLQEDKGTIPLGYIKQDLLVQKSRKQSAQLVCIVERPSISLLLRGRNLGVITSVVD